MCAITDPSWTPLFLAAAAVVCDTGAQQSHAAIVARELGIPAVMSVPGITSVADGGPPRRRRRRHRAASTEFNPEPTPVAPAPDLAQSVCFQQLK